MASSVPELLYVVSIFFLNRLIRKLVKGRHYKLHNAAIKMGKMQTIAAILKYDENFELS